MVSSLSRKLLRELWQMRGQVLTIALVVACGMAVFVTALGTLNSLRAAQVSYYDQFRFADVFVQLKRAPRWLESQLRTIPGVVDLQTRIVTDVTVELAGDSSDPITARLVAIPPDGLRLNQTFLRNGRMLDRGRTDEVLINESFAVANHLKAGDGLTVHVNGHRLPLHIVGIALSPEYIFALRTGDITPDDKRFGIVWISEAALAHAMDMVGAFNDVSFKLSPDASFEQAASYLNRVLEPYGGLGAYGRGEQMSSRNLSDELAQLETQAVFVPAIFLAVAAFLLNVVMSRLVGTQRPLIGALKALGFRNSEIFWHYTQLVLIVAMLGSVVGTVLGVWLGSQLTAFYAQYYRFPSLVYRLDASVITISAGVTLLASLLGAWSAVRRAAKLAPAEAMRSESPQTYRVTFVERLGLQSFFSQQTRMILRQLERQPVRVLMATLAIAFSVALVIAGNYFRDAIDMLVDVQFRRIQQEDATVAFTHPMTLRALRELEHVQGVLYAEPLRVLPIRLVSAHHSRRSAVQGLPHDRTMRQLLDVKLHPIYLPKDGVVMTKELAASLHITAGSSVELQILEGARRTVQVTVHALVEELIGVAVYMDLDALTHLIGEDSTVSAAYIAIESASTERVFHRLKESPNIASINRRETMLHIFRDTLGERLVGLSVVLAIFASIIAVGVVYNSARIALAERMFELGCLRVMGFTRAEISWLLLSELAIQIVLAIPIGFLIGWGLVGAIAEGMSSELFRLPVTVSSRTYALAALTIGFAGLSSGLLVRRKLDHIDLTEVLKNRA